MKKQVTDLFCDRDHRIDNTKTITFLTFVMGWIVTIYAVFKGAPDAYYYLGLMVGAGSGLTISKGIVDTKQKAQKPQEKET